MKHYSKVDFWLFLIIWFSIALSVFSFFMIPDSDRLIGYIVLLPVIVFLLSMLYNTYYIFEEQYLKCVVGGFPQKIYYENIKSIKKTRNLLSSAALSVDRIEIKEKYKGFIRGTTYISPKEKDEFFEELKIRCPKGVEVKS